MESTSPDLKLPKLIFFVLLAGQILFALATAWMISTNLGAPLYILGANEDFYGLVAYAIIMIMLARFMDQTRIRSANNLRRVGGDATQHYLMTVVVRLALLQGASFMVLTFTLLTQNISLCWMLVPLLGAFWLAKPDELEYQERYGS